MASASEGSVPSSPASAIPALAAAAASLAYTGSDLGYLWTSLLCLLMGMLMMRLARSTEPQSS